MVGWGGQEKNLHRPSGNQESSKSTKKGFGHISFRGMELALQSVWLNGEIPPKKDPSGEIIKLRVDIT